MGRDTETVFVMGSPTSTIAECIEARGHRVVSALRPVRFRLARLRRAHLTREAPLGGFWLKRDLGLDAAVGTVVVFDCPEMFGIARAIRRKNAAVRVIVWLWNPLPATWRLPTDLATFEVCTFEPTDVARHGFRQMSTFYFRELAKYASVDKDADLIFIGRDKGRGERIHEAERMVADVGLRADIHVLPGHQMSYRGVLVRTGASRAVLDVVQDGQRGLTLRAMEALFLGVRLVTDNSAIADDQHYPSDNIFDLRGADSGKLATFLEKESHPVEEGVLDFYDFDAWLERLLEQRQEG